LKGFLCVASTYGVVDLFAGPGGLGEGFAGLRSGERHPFRIVLSAEMEASAHATLQLRSFLRAHLRETGNLPPEYAEFHRGAAQQPDWSALHPALWREAEGEALRLTLGSEDARDPLRAGIKVAQTGFDDSIVIGGPPCQAYSLVGRARNKGNQDYTAEGDQRHFLFREYIAVLRALQPAVFVMENVKGMLSSSVGGRRVFDMIMEDLQSLGGAAGGQYELIALNPRSLTQDQPQDFIVRAEEHGVPQRRHRVIIIGVRRDIAAKWREHGGGKHRALLPPAADATVRHMLAGFPALRSGLSKETDGTAAWRQVRLTTAEALAKLPGHRPEMDALTAKALCVLPRRAREAEAAARASSAPAVPSPAAPEALMQFLTAAGFEHIAQHETRGHMRADLARYMFAAAVGDATGVSPKAKDFPPELSPNHANWGSGKFNDRFRAQLWDAPSTTITSHISKDGHYFIHPDPMQCRSLTVREAARLQTFPDDYLFLGNRTQQFVQVGNAVPPFLARQIATAVLDMLEGDGIRR
jgi:DNA (cytosine-5)-methyltransferase 1